MLSVSISIRLVHFAYPYDIYYDMLYFFATLLVNSHSYSVLNVRVCGAMNDCVVGCLSYCICVL